MTVRLDVSGCHHYADVMARWEPDTPQRLQAAALELFATQGFEQTTAAEIAAAVGLTERTFFRHFADKREVLFHGQDQFVQAFLEGVEAAPTDAEPLAVVAAAVASAGSLFPDDRRRWSRMRQVVIDAHPSLQERERNKLAQLATVLATALRERGIDEPAATLAGESGATIFGVAFGRWIADGETRGLAEISAEVWDVLRGLTSVRP